MPNSPSDQQLKTVFIMILICHDRSHPPIFLKSSSAWQKSSLGSIPLCVIIGHVSRRWNTSAIRDNPIRLKLSKTCQMMSKPVFTSSKTIFLNSAVYKKVKIGLVKSQSVKCRFIEHVSTTFLIYV